MAAFRWEAAALVLNLKVKPRAKRFAFGPIVGDAIQVQVPAVPEDGKATDVLLRELAGLFQVRSRTISLVSGAFTPHKVVRVENPQFVPAVLNAVQRRPVSGPET